ISLLGKAFARRARAAGIPGNRRFSGVHDFSGATPYGRLFAAFLKGLEPGALVMAHPGLSDAALAAADRVTTQREEEYRYFLSDAFRDRLGQSGVRIARFAQTGRPGR
ncbi:MAG: ChbG/HpnK family deacetylase, partial [Alphaproteobacteria bacterium]